MTDLFLQAGFFLLKSLAQFLSILLLMRFFMQLFRVSFNNQVGTFVVQLTNWAVLPLRRVLPGAFGLDLSRLLPAEASGLPMALAAQTRLPASSVSSMRRPSAPVQCIGAWRACRMVAS